MTDTVSRANGNGYKAPPRELVDPESVEAEKVAAAIADGWVKPNPTGSPTLPPLPVERMPKVLADIASAAAAEVQVPVDMGGVLSISTTSAAVAGKVEIEARGGHLEQLPTWTFTAAESAERKTALFNILRKPFTDYEQEHQRERLMEIRRAEMRKKRLEAALSAKVKKAAETLSSQDLAEEEALHEQLEDLKIPPKLQLWVSSPTPEAVHNLLSEHDGRMAVFSDEGGLFGIIAGRYAGKGGGADIDPFLQGYNGSPLRAPRVTAERKNVPAAYLSMGFTVQPKVLAELGTVDGIEDKGLVGRFLFSLPVSTVGTRRYRDAVPIAEDIANAYAATMRRLIEMPVPARPHRLLLTPEAWEVYADFADRIEARLDRKAGDLARIGSWGGKIAGTTLRIAALFHLVEHEDALERSVDRIHIENAAYLAEEYFIPHALAAFRVVRHGAEKSVTQRLVAWIADNQLKQFTLRDAFQQLKGGKAGRVQSVDDVLPALTHLEDGGWIRQVEATRRNTVAFEVNPLWDYQ
jgi:hypothetical protein